VTGVSSSQSGGAPPAAGGGPGDDLAGPQLDDVPGQLHPHGGDEPVPVRLPGRPQAGLQVFAAADRALHGPGQRAVARPDLDEAAHSSPSTRCTTPPANGYRVTFSFGTSSKRRSTRPMVSLKTARTNAASPERITSTSFSTLAKRFCTAPLGE